MLNLHKNGFAIPRPIDSNRHAIIMEIIDGFNLNQLVSLEE
jgi:RIO kinase 2